MRYYQVIIDGEVKNEVRADSKSQAQALMDEFYPGATYAPVERVTVAVIRDDVVENVIVAESASSAAESIALREQESS